MQVNFRGFQYLSKASHSLHTHLYTNGSQSPAFSPDFLKLHTQTVSMSHTYLKFNMTKHCSLCIFCPVTAIIYHLVTNARNPGVLESSFSFMPHLPSANSGFQIFLESGSLLYSFSTAPQAFTFICLTIATAPNLVSAPGLFPSNLPPPPSAGTINPECHGLSSPAGSSSQKQTRPSKARAPPPSLFSALNTPPSDLFLVAPTTPSETEVASSYSSGQISSGIPPLDAHT